MRCSNCIYGGSIDEYGAVEEYAEVCGLVEENEITFKLQREYPNKKFYPVTDLAVCPNMKKNSLDKVLNVLKEMTNEIKVPKEIADKAIVPIQRMLEVKPS